MVLFFFVQITFPSCIAQSVLSFTIRNYQRHFNIEQIANIEDERKIFWMLFSSGDMLVSTCVRPRIATKKADKQNLPWLGLHVTQV